MVVKNDANCIATKRPGIHVKYRREIEPFPEVGCNHMWVDSWGKLGHYFHHDRDVTQEEAMGWFWLWEESAVNEASVHVAERTKSLTSIRTWNISNEHIFRLELKGALVTAAERLLRWASDSARC